jgi:hypothetical protein
MGIGVDNVQMKGAGNLIFYYTFVENHKAKNTTLLPYYQAEI